MSLLKSYLFDDKNIYENNNQNVNNNNTDAQQNILIAGPVSSGKTSILFKMACKVAETGGRVLFVTDQQRLYKKLPYQCINTQQSSSTLKSSWSWNRVPPYLNKIDMKYFGIEQNNSSYRNMIEYFSNVHMVSELYELIVIENFDSYFPNHKNFSCVLSLVENARAYFSFKLQKKVMTVLSTNLVKKGSYNDGYNYHSNYFSSSNNSSNSNNNFDHVDPMYIHDEIKYLHIYQRTMTDIFKIYNKNVQNDDKNNNNNNKKFEMQSPNHYTIRNIKLSAFNKGSLAPRYFSPVPIRNNLNNVSFSFSKHESLQLPHEITTTTTTINKEEVDKKKKEDEIDYSVNVEQEAIIFL